MASASTWVRPFQFGQRQLTAVAWWGGRKAERAQLGKSSVARSLSYEHFGPNRPHTRLALDHLPSPALGPAPPCSALPVPQRTGRDHVQPAPHPSHHQGPGAVKGGRLGWVGL